MKKNELIRRLRCGEKLEDIIEFTSGQECDIFKEKWRDFESDDLVYIPDIYVNDEVICGRPMTENEIEDFKSVAYTWEDFIDEADGDENLAKRAFINCDWQHPSTEIEQIKTYDYENGDEE